MQLRPSAGGCRAEGAQAGKFVFAMTPTALAYRIVQWTQILQLKNIRVLEQAVCALHVSHNLNIYIVLVLLGKQARLAGDLQRKSDTKINTERIE
jgi:hypothetical protein